MKLLSRLLLVAAAAVAALAMSASSAVANGAIEVYEEGSGQHCGQVSVSGHMPSGGCHISVDGQEIELSGHVFGIEQHSLTCDNTFDINIQEDGVGYVSNMLVTAGDNHDPGCVNVRPCISEGNHAENHEFTEGNEAGEHAWRFELEEIGSAGSETGEGHVWACFHTEEAIEECEGEIDFLVTEVAGQPEHFIEAQTVGNTGHPVGQASLPEGAGTFSTHCEVTGHYDLEPEEELHINHLGA